MSAVLSHDVCYRQRGPFWPGALHTSVATDDSVTEAIRKVSDAYHHLSMAALDTSRASLEASYEKLNSLRLREENWDSYGSAAPQPVSIAQAEDILGQFFSASLEENALWLEPHLSSSEAGAITIEWWSRDKKLTIYAEAGEPSYIKVWGTDIDNEMEDGVVGQQDPVSLWRWLVA